MSIKELFSGTGKRKLAAVLIILAVAVLLELTLFNRAHYAHLWQGEETSDFEAVNIRYSPDLGLYSTLFCERCHDEYDEEGFLEPCDDCDKRAGICRHCRDFVYDDFPAENDEEMSAFVFRDLNRRVNSVYIKPGGGYGETLTFFIVYGDEENSRKTTVPFDVVAGVEHTLYQEINPYGKVDYIRVVPLSGNFSVWEVALNKTIPFEFVWGRVLIVFAAAAGLYFLLTCDIRRVIFDPKCRKQKLAFSAILLMFAGLGSWLNITVFSVATPDQYARMAESIIEGRIDLKILEPEDFETLKNMNNPYDWNERVVKEIPLFEFDNSYYNGKIYMQHGIGPVLVMFLPHYLIFGVHMPEPNAIFIFTALAGVFMALMWREIVKRYFRQMPLVVFLCSTAAVLWCCFVSPQFFFMGKHSVASSSGIMFVGLGMWLLFRAMNAVRENNAISKKQYAMIAAGCFCVAFAVNCRASTVLSSFLVPVVLWEVLFRGKKKLNIPAALCVAVPYLAIALPLMWYNYVRFDSVFEFGTGYALTCYDNRFVTDLNPAGILKLFVESIRNIFFAPLKFSYVFPFVETTGMLSPDAAAPNRYYSSHIGMINLPVFWGLGFLPFVFRKRDWGYSEDTALPRRKLLLLCEAMLAIGFATGICNYVLVAAQLRYQADYMYLLLFPALICGYMAWEKLGRSLGMCRFMCFAFIISTAIMVPLASNDWTFRAIFLEPAFAEIKRLFTFF